MPNVGSLISSHNKKTLSKSSEEPNPTLRTCNCRDKNLCPLNGVCLTQALIYEAQVTPEEGNPGRYIGLCEPEFKGRYNDHKTSCTHQKYETKTELAEYYWQHKKRGIESTIKFSILQKRFPYRIGAKKCDLCLTEKLFIMKEGDKVLNKRDELVSKCRHVNKFLMKNFKTRNR